MKFSAFNEKTEIIAILIYPCLVIARRRPLEFLAVEIRLRPDDLARDNLLLSDNLRSFIGFESYLDWTCHLQNAFSDGKQLGRFFSPVSWASS